MALANLKHERAARMIAEDRETDDRIAGRLGVCRRTLANWKHRSDIKARIQEISDDGASRLTAYSDRFEWLWVRECCRIELSSKNPIAKRVAIIRLQEMGGI